MLAQAEQRTTQSNYLHPLPFSSVSEKTSESETKT